MASREAIDANLYFSAQNPVHSESHKPHFPCVVHTLLKYPSHNGKDTIFKTMQFFFSFGWAKGK